MIRDITIGQHFPGNSILHRLDPQRNHFDDGIHQAFIAANPAGLALAAAPAGILYRVANIPLRIILKAQADPSIIVFTVVGNLFFITGESQPLA